MRTPKRIRMAVLAAASTRTRAKSAPQGRGVFAGWLGTRGLSGGDLETRLTDAIDAWHNTPDDGTTLHDYLGLSWEEYGVWVEQRGSISDILRARLAS